MSGPVAEVVAATRVVPPVLPAGYVARGHLLGPLRDAAEDPRVALVLVSAPAGAGKTTLLAALARDGQRANREVAWLQIEAVDRDPSRFWTDVALAVERVRPDTADPVLIAAGSTGGAGEATVPVLVNLLATGPPLVVVLDDRP
jgi:LuxR family maltose regulon positive regulatory protein